MMNAGVFKLAPKYVPNAVGGASGWIGGLGAFGGFVIPPIMGYFVDSYQNSGYAYGYIVFVILSLVCLVIVGILTKTSQD